MPTQILNSNFNINEPNRVIIIPLVFYKPGLLCLYLSKYYLGCSHNSTLSSEHLMPFYLGTPKSFTFFPQNFPRHINMYSQFHQNKTAHLAPISTLVAFLLLCSILWPKIKSEKHGFIWLNIFNLSLRQTRSEN